MEQLEFLHRFEWGKKAMEPMQKVLKIMSRSEWEKDKLTESETRSW